MPKKISMKEMRERIRWQVDRNDRRVDALSRRSRLLLAGFAGSFSFLFTLFMYWQPSYLELRLGFSYFLGVGAFLFLLMMGTGTFLIREKFSISFRFALRMPFIYIPVGALLVLSAFTLAFIFPPYENLTSLIVIWASMFMYMFLGIGFLFARRMTSQILLDKGERERLKSKKNLAIGFAFWILILALWLRNALNLIDFWSVYVSFSTVNLILMNLFCYLAFYFSVVFITVVSYKSGYEQINEEYGSLYDGYEDRKRIRPRKVLKRFEELMARQEELTIPKGQLFLMRDFEGHEEKTHETSQSSNETLEEETES